MRDNFVWIDPDQLGESGESVEIDGVRIVLDLSPSNRPTAVFGRLLKRPRRFEVGFEYTDNEPEGSRQELGGITFVEGRYSGKLLRIEVATKGVGVVELQTRLAKAVDQRTQSLRPGPEGDAPFGQFLNSRAATNVLSSDDLFRRISDGLVSA